MAESAPWRGSLAELGLDTAQRHLLGAGQPLHDPPTKRKFANNGQEAHDSKRRPWRPDSREPIVDTPPTPAALSDGPDFWNAAPAGDGALRPELSRQLGHCSRPAAAGGGQRQQRQPRAAAALGWRSAPQRSFPPSGGGLEVQEISSELWQEPGQEQERSASLESCSSLSTGAVLVQEAETDQESVPGTPERPREGEHGVSIVELHFAEEGREDLWEQRADETEQPLVLPEPIRQAAAVQQGGNERAFFSLRSVRRLMLPVRRCLSPMAEESCEEMDWSESPPAASASASRQQGQLGREEEEEVASSTSGTPHVQEEEEKEEEEEEVCRGSPPAESQSMATVEGEETWSASLPNEARVRVDVKMEETSSASLPVESRSRCDVSRIEGWSESLPVESRIRNDGGEEKAESAPAVSRIQDQTDCDMTDSGSLLVKSRVKAGDSADKGLTNGLSDESMASSDESMKNEPRSAGKDDAAGPSPTSGRLTRHRTSWSLPNDAVKYDFKTSFISRTNGSSTTNGQTVETNNGVTRVSWSLPNEARMRETKGSPESLTKEPRKREPDVGATTTVSSSLPNEAISRVSSRRKVNLMSCSLPNEARIKEEEGSASLPNEARLRPSDDDMEVKTSSSSLPNETRRKEIDETTKKMSASLPNRSRARVSEDQSRIKSSSPRKSEDAANISEEDKAEIIDRTDDKKYNFSALRMKRKQAQQATKSRKESTARSTSTKQSKQLADSSETGRKSSACEDGVEGRDSEGIRSSTPAMVEQKRDLTAASRRATTNFGGSEKSSESLSTVSGPKTSQKIIEDLESDASWRTIRSTDSKEDNNSDNGLEPPSVVTPLADLECYVTETLILTAEVRGQPCPEARWVIKPFLSSQQGTSVCTYRDGQSVETGDHRLLQRQGQYRHRLVIPRLSYIDAGQYTAIFSSPQGETASQCKVVVKPLTELKAPHFFTPLVARTVWEGEKAEFSCEVRGSPLPSVTWFKGSVKLKPSSAVRMSYKLTTGLCSLTLLQPEAGDGGRLVCRASNQHGHTEVQTTLQVLEKEALSSSNPTEMAPQYTVCRTAAEMAPPGATVSPTAEEARSDVTPPPTEEVTSSDKKSHQKEETSAIETTSTHRTVTKTKDVSSSQNEHVATSDVTHRAAKEQAASEINPASQNERIPSSDPSASLPNVATSEYGSLSYPTEKAASSGDEMRSVKVLASPGIELSPTERQWTPLSSGDISSLPSAPEGAPQPSGCTSTPLAASEDSPRTVGEPETPPNTSLSLERTPVVMEHPIEMAPPADKPSSETPPAEKSSKPVHKSPEDTPSIGNTSVKVSSIDRVSHERGQPADRVSGSTGPEVRSHPVELTLSSVRSHPIHVPSPMEVSHPIEVAPPVNTSTAEKTDGRSAQPVSSPSKIDRLRQPPPPAEEDQPRAEPTETPPPPAEGAGRQLTAPARSGADTADTADSPGPGSDRSASQPRAPEPAVSADAGRPWNAEQRVLSKPPPVISWPSDARSVFGSTRVKDMTSPEGEQALEVAETTPEEAATNELTATSEEPQVTGSTEPAAEVATMEEPAATEEAPAAEEASTLAPAAEPVSPAAEPTSPAAEPASPAAESARASEEPVVASEDVVPEDPPSVQPPSVEEALLPVQAVAGCPGRLEGRVSGLPKPTIAWTRDGATLHPDGERVRSYHHDDGTFGLEIAESRAEDVGTYAATAVNSSGQAATEAVFQLLDTSTAGKEWAPDFTTPLLGAKVDEGGAIELDTHITGVPIPEVSWTKDGVPLEAGERVTIGYDSDKATLSITPAEAADAGKYEITVRNQLGEISAAVKVKINKIYTAPQFAENLMDVQQVPSLDAKFACRVTALPKPEVQWLFNGQALKSSKKHKIRRDEDACTLSVRECSEEDAGTYTCRATNSEGTVSTSADLRVVDRLDRKPKLEAPLFLKSIGDCEVFPGMQAKFTGCVAGNPEPECEWYRNDVRIYPSDRIVVENDGSGLVRLTLRTVDETDAGRYRLKIRNSEGEAACEADLTYDSFENTPTKPLKDQYQTLERQLKSGIPMPLPDPPIVSRMSDRQLTLSWKPSPAAGQHIPPTYTVEMAKLPEGGFAVINTGVRGCSVEIKRLEPHCDYKFRVIVENKHGASEPSPHAVAHRVGLVPAPPPENPCLPDGDTFRADSSPLFPRGFDMEKHTGNKGHPPTFLRQESNMQYGVKGRDVRLRWYIFGFPKPDFSFTFNNTTIEMTGRFSCSYNNAGELTLVINSMQERDQGVYEAMCTSRYGEARQKVILRMSEPPRFQQHPEETTVMQREQARFEARVTGVPVPEIQWYKDWKPLKKDKRVRILWREPDTCILLVNDCLVPRDGGLYSVSATTPAGTTTASATLHVEFDDAMYNYISYSPARSVKPRNKAFEDFCDIGEELGRGTQAATYHVIQRSNGCSFAAKAMNGKGDHRLSMNSEMWMMNQLHDRQLARLYDAYESPRQLILVQELCSGGEVIEALCREPTYNESDVASVVRQVLWGLQSMHLKHIAHLGLTPADILFSRPNGDEVKLIDFSLARHINPEKPERLDYGMPEFVAPEAVNGERVGLPADMWSVGIITYLLLSGTSPFRGETDRDTLKRIQSGEMQYDLEVFAEISDEAKDFISKLLVFSAAGRPDVKTALKHPWLKFADRTPASIKDRSTDRLKVYLEKFRAWYRNASCQTWFRRRPLSSAFEHPSEMVYPPDVVYTPPPSPEPIRKEKWAPARQEEPEEEVDAEPPLDDQLEWIGAESHYQQGPDTYLLQLRDTGLPSRLREYIKVAADRSPTFAQRAFDEPMYDRTGSRQGSGSGLVPPCPSRAGSVCSTVAASVDVADGAEPVPPKPALPAWCQLPVLHERRRFTDIMDEEIDDERRSRIDKYSAEQGHYQPRRLRYELSARPKALAEADAVREQKRQGQFPYFREKPFDMAIQEGQPAQLSCLAVGTPKPIVQWFRNDVVIGETRRIKIVEDATTGRSILRLQPAMDFDQGVYKVICRNNVGQTVAKCRLYMGYDPGSCDLPDVADYTDTEVLLRWKVPTDTGYSPIIAYGLQAKQLIEHQWKDIAENIGHEFYVVKELKPESNYHFRLKARNKLGWGPYSVPTPTVRTRGAGWPKRLELGKVETLLMQMTELGTEPEDPEARPDLDYQAEENPVTLTQESPEQAYTFLAEIYRGRFSLVATCVHTMSSTIRAAKLIEVGSEKSLDQAMAEFESLRSLRHERVVALYDAYRMDTKLVLVTEKLLGQDVLSFFQSQHNYSEEMVASVVTQMLDGLQYLHWRGVAHLDLQPDNVVLASCRRLSVKLVDLGSAQRVSKLGKMVRSDGHLDFTAPELLVDEPAFPQTDVWSLGAIAYLLLSGQAPFLGDSEQETRQNTLYVRFRFEYLHKEITNEATRFLMTLFKRAPSKRPSCEQCLEHRWLMSIEYMQKRRERAIFLGNRLKDYSQSYHQARHRQATQNTDLIAAFTMDLLTT